MNSTFHNPVCTTAPAGTPKATLVAIHRSKMMSKFFKRQEPLETPHIKYVAQRQAWINKKFRSPVKRAAAHVIINQNQRRELMDKKLKEL